MHANRVLSALCAVLLLVGCNSATSEDPAPEGSGGSEESQTPGDDEGSEPTEVAEEVDDVEPPIEIVGGGPISVEAYRTTSGSIALNNLDGLIVSMDEQFANTGQQMFQLRGALHRMERGRVVGSVEDVVQAGVMLEAVIAAEPDNATAYQARAGVRAYFHDFESALADLERSEELGADASENEARRGEILLALGRVDEATEIIEARGRTYRRSLTALASLANLRLDQGREVEARSLFRQAETAYDDTAPLLLSWLHVQHGVGYLRNGDHERARVFFQAAYDRYPQYYLAAEHLAETMALSGDLEDALELYTAVIDQTGNPEFWSAMAGVQEELGMTADAESSLTTATAEYERLIAEHGAAFWQHAAEFFLETGNAARAHELAVMNAEVRQDVHSMLLLAETSLSTGDTDGACEAWGAARATGLNPPEMGEASAELQACP